MVNTQQDIRLGVRRTLNNEYHYGGSENMAKRKQKSSSGMDIPDYHCEALARCLLPKIQKYYESEEGRKALADYRAGKAKKANAEKQNK